MYRPGRARRERSVEHRRSRRSSALFLLALLVVLTSCGGGDDRTADLVVSEGGYEIAVWASGLSGPTQMVFAADGDLIIAELNGAENDGTGRVLRIAADDRTDRVVLQDGLNKPTGIAVAGDTLWIMEQRTLSRTSLAPGAPREVIAGDLPFNGRSEGTLTMTPDGTLLFDTSGAKRGPDRVPGSGTLYAIANAATEPGEPTVVATGFKHAYAHVVDHGGQLWSVEMTDGNFDGERASDELVPIRTGDDGGWPSCVDDNRPVVEYGGTPERCAASPRSHALLGVGATPTSIVVSPWDADTFILALWLPGEVVTVPRSVPESAPHRPTLFLDGLESPQHLLVYGDALLVSDHETGQIFAVTTG